MRIHNIDSTKFGRCYKIDCGKEKGGSIDIDPQISSCSLLPYNESIAGIKITSPVKTAFIMTSEFIYASRLFNMICHLSKMYRGPTGVGQVVLNLSADENILGLNTIV